ARAESLPSYLERASIWMGARSSLPFSDPTHDTRAVAIPTRPPDGCDDARSPRGAIDLRRAPSRPSSTSSTSSPSSPVRAAGEVVHNWPRYQTWGGEGWGLRPPLHRDWCCSAALTTG